MTPETGSAEPTGLARSIRDLFSRETPPRSTDAAAESGGGDDVAWVAEAGVRLPGDVNAPDPLLEAVKGYVKSDPGDRAARRATVEAAVEEARERRAGAAMADAAEALAHFSERDPEAREVALPLVTPGVATLLVARIGQAADDEDRRAELVQILPRLGDEMEVAVLEALRNEARDQNAQRSVRRSLLALVSAMADRGSDLLTRMLEEPDWRVVRNAIHLLGDREGEDLLQHLTVALAHSDSRVRKEALSALGKLGGEDAGMLALGQLEDHDPAVRAQAARTVGILQVERALKPLLALLEKEDDQAVVVEVIRALGLLGDPSAVIPLEKRAVPSLFSRAPQEVRVAAYRALGGIGTPHAMELVEKAADDKDTEVRRTAEAILKARDQG